jgi:hypothetical protein
MTNDPQGAGKEAGITERETSVYTYLEFGRG